MLQSLQSDLAERSFDCGLSVVLVALLKFTFALAVEVEFSCAIQPGLLIFRSGFGIGASPHAVLAVIESSVIETMFRC